MTCPAIYNFCMKRAGYWTQDFTVTLQATGAILDLTDFDTTELLVYDAPEGDLLFTSTGVLTGASGKSTFTILPAVTASLTQNTLFYYWKLSNTGDATLDTYYLYGTIGLI